MRARVRGKTTGGKLPRVSHDLNVVTDFFLSLDAPLIVLSRYEENNVQANVLKLTRKFYELARDYHDLSFLRLVSRPLLHRMPRAKIKKEQALVSKDIECTCTLFSWSLLVENQLLHWTGLMSHSTNNSFVLPSQR